VDHTDERAVIFTYSLYQASREENSSLTQIAELVEGKLNGKWNEKVSKLSSGNSKNEHIQEKNKMVLEANVQVESEKSQKAVEGRYQLVNEDSLHNVNTKITQKQNQKVIEKQKPMKSSVPSSNRIVIPSIQRPVMEERFESERIKMIYPNSCYIKAGISFLCIVITVGIMLSHEFLRDKVSNEIVFPKLIAVLIIVVAIEAYFLSKVFQKEAKVEKVISEVKYVPDNILHSTPVATSIDYTYGENKEDRGERFPIYDSKGQKEDCYNRNGHEALSKNACEERYEEKTQLLSAIQPDYRYRLKAKDNLRYQDIPLIEFPFFIGKIKMNVDYALDNTLVSRFHAKISKESEEFFITDLNSTNGTFLNDVRIEPQKMVTVNLGDSIAFADAVFTFEEVGLSY
ncbi:MAG TPA: FHA domain-containing protein, partial [Lachnospiraceae bacterium]|nr:FHA domain-containing protein [Lachnospiraceae bacterium]